MIIRPLFAHAAFYLLPLLAVLIVEFQAPGLLTQPIGWAVAILLLLLLSTAFAVYGSINAKRHFIEIAAGLFIQAGGLICYFALLFRANGLVQNGIAIAPPFRTALYFSMVTWTTLGYGDIQPTDTLRLFAATEALLGYVYLGLIVGLLGKAFR